MSNCNCGNVSLPNGSNGLNGYNAFTVTTASFAMPAVGSSVNIAVSASGQYTGLWALLGQVIFITDGTDAGYFEVTTAGTQTTIGIENLGYTGNAIAGATFGSGSKVSPSGLVGPTGSNGTDGTSILQQTYTSTPINQTGSYAQFTSLSLNPGFIAATGDTLVIYAKFFYSKNSATATNYGRIKIQLYDGANTVELLVAPTTWFGGASYVQMDSVLSYCEVEIIVSRNSTTTCNFEYKYKVGTALSYSLEEYYLTPNLCEIGGEKLAVSTVTWANTVNVNILGEVDDATDYIKMGFAEIDFKQIV